jgi:two-component system sensor histidine kinase KdpD
MQSAEYPDNRPDPDTILKRIHKETRGKLTIFLGATAGVGKTFAMLKTAHERLQEGTNIIIGWVDTHGRKETEQLVAGLSVIPAKFLNYRGKKIPEMDTDAILTRNPELVLVDELAHTNIPGSRNVRRFQDVEELLSAGINVYTTLNIQHIESLNDVVAQVTGVVVRETVPDYVVDQADKVQLIDIPSEDLIERLQEGKVYIPGQAEQAMRKFFRQGNINALRELALRYTASRVDKDLSAYMREHNIDGPWPAAGRVMVCVSGSPFSAHLVRAASRLASGMKAECLAVHIEETRRRLASDFERERIARNMRLAEELGAKTLSITADDLPDKIVELARVHNVTAIVIGKPRRSWWHELIHGSVVNRLIRKSGNLNIYVIQTEHEPETENTAKSGSPLHARTDWRPYAGSAFMVAMITLASHAARNQIEQSNIALLYQLPVVLGAYWWGRWPAYFTGVCSVLAFDYLFVPPFYTFSVDDMRYLWSFFTFLIVAFVIGGRTELLRHEAVTAQLREKNTQALFEFSREIAAVIDLDTIVRQLAKRAADALDRRIMVLLPDEQGRLAVYADFKPLEGDCHTAREPIEDSAEAAVAAWAYEHRRIAGRSTETLPGASNLYIPLVTRENVVGLLGVKVVEKLITPEQQKLMEAWAALAAIAIERVRLTEKAREATLVLESDRLRTALLNSISHELRTPLASIMGSASTLLESDSLYSADERHELLENITDGSKRMNLILSNLLDTARIESGMMKLKYDWCDIEDVIGTALQHLSEQVENRRLEINIRNGTPLLQGDCVLLGQVILNLIDNALKYSPEDSSIEIQASATNEGLTVSVADHGIGIPATDMTKVFDKFYRVQHSESSIPGTGLGLSICKSIVEAHGGKIWAENRSEGGTVFSFSIPLMKITDQPVLGDKESR